MINYKSIASSLFLALGVFYGSAAEPAGYYSKCENQGGANLLKTLQTVVGNHTVVSYDGLWDVYKTSDVKPNGKLWDMYSTKEWTFGQEKCGNYKNVGDCYNREHSMPKSWFNEAKPMYSDAFHLYPTDGKVNGQRSNYPYGECANGTTLASSGGVKALGRLGKSTFSGYSGTVFEPDDQYKGDFARSYFYMAAAYNDKIAGWDSDMLSGNSYPAFAGWAVEMLLKWHRQDPVSDKELARNEAVYAYQKNRNPFIDHPEMVEYIWGDKKNEKWTSSAAEQPVLNVPANNSTINLGTVGVGVARTFTVAVQGKALKNNLTVSLSDASGVFSVTPSTLSASAVNSSAGTSLTVTVNAKQQKQYTSTLTIKSTSDNINTTVTLSVNALSGLPATAPTNITDESFVAHWTYVGDADNNGCYTLYVLNEDGDNVDTYPRSVPALDEEYLVDELMPETTYSFYITNKLLKSNVMTVTTAAPIPNVQILYDGDLVLLTEPGLPSDVEELLLDIENIYTDVTFSVDAPFQLSSDKSNWSTTLVLDPREDRMYIRLFGDNVGVYTSEIRAVAGDYINDNAEVTGTIAETTSFLEDFEKKGSGNYSTTKYVGTACEWTFSDAGVYEVKDETYNGNGYLRFGKTNGSSATMAVDKPNGAGTVTLYAAGWSASDGSSKFKLQYSTDGGKSWTDAGEATIDAPASSTKSYKPYTFTVNVSGDVRLRIQQTYGQRMCIDDFSVTNYRTSANDDIVFGDEAGNGWDAYCLGGELVVALSRDAVVAVHGVDGVTYVNAHFGQGEHRVVLPAGLYVIVVGNSTRRVLVK